MTFGKDAPPLPMYERIVLKHVPTMVRRRYDRDLLNNFDDATTNKDQDSKSKDDEEEDANHSDVDDSVDQDVHLNLDIEQKQEQEQDAPEDFDGNNHGSSASLHLESTEIEGDGTKDFILDKDHGNSDYEQGIGNDPKSKDSQRKSEGAKYVNENIIGGDGHAKFDSENDSCSEDCRSDDDVAKHANIGNSMDDNVNHEVQDNEPGFHMVHCEGEGDGAKDANVSCYKVMDTSVKDEVLDNNDGEFDIEQNMKMNYGDLQKFNGDEVYVIRPEDEYVVICDVVDNAKDEHENKEHENFHNKQEHCTSEDDGVIDATPPRYNEDKSFEDEVDDKKDETFDNKQGLSIEDSKNQDKGADYENLASCGNAVDSVKWEVQDNKLGNSNNEHEFCPEAFKETLEQDGYDLCCPNCKRYITQTMIFRRKEGQHYKTTCCSFLIALFGCIRWQS